MLSVKDSILHKINKHEKCHNCVMDLISHLGITLNVWQVCDTTCLLFFGLKSPLSKKYFSDLNLYEAVKSSGSVVQLKLKCLLMKPTQDDIIKTKKVYSQLSYE